MDAKQLPARPNLEQFRKQAKDLLKARRTPEAIRRIKAFHPQLTKRSETEIAETKLSLADAQCVIALEHAFESWPKFVQHIEQILRAGSPVSKFESAADAIVTGDTASLKRLLQEHPELARARSTRSHGAPLIHYVAANGVEDFRQKTPKNIVEITRVLLDAGAEIDATTQAYGAASTALGLAATSYHPSKAGLQLNLLELLLQAGASIDGAPGGWSPLIAALHNGRGEAAEFLASHGARLDLEGAAGVGRVDAVADYIGEGGTLKSGATTEQLNYGFIWACEYGRTEVVRFLLGRGVGPDLDFKHRETPLHWAAFGGHADIVDLLLNAKAPVNLTDQSHGGTPLGWAIYGWNDPPPESKMANYYAVVESLVAAGATLDWEWMGDPNRGDSLAAKIRADARIMAVLKPR